MPAFALTIFTGAFLLFQVQPLIGKYILPWFGGSPGVWTTCMLFFQMLLLGGYAYAHVVTRKLSPRAQAVVHVVLIAVALLTLPIIPTDSWKPHASGNPTWHILALLAVTLGLPYLVLAATGPLMQEWFRRTAPGVSPYRLYSLSNIGSLLALVSYPFFFETNFTRQAQATFWSWGLVVYAVAAGFCAWRVWKKPAEVAPAAGTPTEPAPAPTALQRTLWLALPACASVLLLAVTNKMCQDVAVIPFLWVLPLALYLLTFIISFDSPRWYSRFYYTIGLIAALVAVSQALYEGADMAIVQQIIVYSAMLFVGCMVCHGELYQLKPHPQHLTSYYLMISAGGAVGGLFVALAAPALFNDYYEMHLALGLTALLLVVLSVRGRAALTPRRWSILFGVLAVAGAYGLYGAVKVLLPWLKQRDLLTTPPSVDYEHWLLAERFDWVLWSLPLVVLAGAFVWYWRRQRDLNWHALSCSLLGAGFCALVVALGIQIRNSSHGAVLSARNFYGVLSVYEYNPGSSDHYYLLQHGRITHGLQFAAPDRARMITSYFGPGSGIGLAFRHYPRQENKRVGLLGLGVGTVAGYGKSGDYFRIYEINPQVKEIADKPFSYVPRSDAKVDIVMGDGRLSMENEPPQNFDFLIMDAFSSDAVPVHLLTREAFEIYQRHLKPDGAILVNISNRYLNLRPVVENAAATLGYKVVHIDNNDGGGDEDNGEGETGWWLYASSWMILTRNEEFLNRSALRAKASPPADHAPIRLWTDDYTSMFKILH